MEAKRVELDVDEDVVDTSDTNEEGTARANDQNRHGELVTSDTSTIAESTNLQKR